MFPTLIYLFSVFGFQSFVPGATEQGNCLPLKVAFRGCQTFKIPPAVCLVSVTVMPLLNEWLFGPSNFSSLNPAPCGICLLLPMNAIAVIQKTESPWPLHFKHSHWWKRWSRSKFASHYTWGTNGVCECVIDVKFTWISTWHWMHHVSWSLGLFLKTTSWR